MSRLELPEVLLVSSVSLESKQRFVQKYGGRAIYALEKIGEWGDEAPTQLGRHITDIHWSPRYLADGGIAYFDIELAGVTGTCLNGIVGVGFTKLTLTDEEIAIATQEDFKDAGSDLKRLIKKGLPWFNIKDSAIRRSGYKWGPRYYRDTIFRNLMYMQLRGVAQVDLDAAYRILPGSQSLSIDLNKYAFDPTFEANL